MLALLLAAGMAVQVLPATLRRQPPKARTLDQRLSLMEARQMLEGQQLWSLQADLPPPDVLKALGDVELHVEHDQEQDDRVRELTDTVQQLQQRLAALELVLQDRAGPAEQGSLRVVPSPESARIEAPVVRSHSSHPTRGPGAASAKARKHAAHLKVITPLRP